MASLFVHHAASGVVASDARWRSIGESVLKFSPCRRTEIASVGIGEQHALDTGPRNEAPTQGLSNHGIVIDDQKSSRGNLSSSPSVRRLSRARGSKRDHARIDDGLNARGLKRSHRSPQNELSSEDLTTSQVQDRCTLRTPNPKRRRSTSKGVCQVPFTGIRPLKHAPNEAIVCCPSSGFPDVTLSFLQPQVISSSVQRNAPCIATDDVNGSRPLTSQLELQSPSFTSAELRQSPKVPNVSPKSVERSRRSTRAGNPPRFALQSLSTNTRKSHSSSLPSTESCEASGGSKEGSGATLEDVTGCIPNRAEIFGPVSSPELGKSCRDDMMDVSGTDFESVLQLPRTVECQVPSSAERRHHSYIPASLSKLGIRYDLQNRFRPRTVRRNIGRAERGYWRLLVRVTTATDAQRARGEWPSTSQRSDLQFLLRQEKKITDDTSPRSRENRLHQAMFPAIDPTTFTPWSEAEFLQTFRELEKLIVRGRLGWGVRLIVEDRIVNGTFVDMNVRLYIFGEMIAHTWLVLMGVSGGLVADLPMVWVSQGEPIVTMTGQKSRGGNLGSWLFWEDGNEGFCGVARAAKRSSCL